MASCYLRPVMRIALVGNGNLAWHISEAMRLHGMSIAIHYSRNNTPSLGWPLVHSIEQLPRDCDLYLLAVPDASITEIAAQLPKMSSVVHFSGSTSLDAIPQQSKAVCWPIQTLTRGTNIDYHEIPILWECSEPGIRQKLEVSLQVVWGKWIYTTSEQRQQAHLAAVISNNFTNHLQHITQELLASADLPTDLTLPMLRTQVELLRHHRPSDIQTGPARRNDVVTIQKQMDALEYNQAWKKLYEIISDDIRKAVK